MKKNEDPYVETFLSLSDFVERWIKGLLLLILLLSIIAQCLLQTNMHLIISPLERMEGIPYTDDSTAREMIKNQLLN